MALAKRDISGERYGRWTVLKKIGPYLHRGRQKDWVYLCRCDCGTEREVKSGALSRGISKSCGCLAAHINSQNHIHDLVGNRFGDWKVIERGRNRATPKDQRKTYWKCQCVHCGHIKDIYAGNLTSGKSKRCTCQIEEKAKNNVESFWHAMNKTYIDGAKKRNIPFSLTQEQVRLLMEQDCSYCGSPPQDRKAHVRLRCVVKVNGIDRKDSSIGYTKENCIPCCKVCNTMKMDLTVEEFLDRITKIYKKMIGV
jgi:hypothetical protein